VCPCCTGKVSAERKDGYRFGATGSNELRVAYPRSAAVRATLTPSEYNFLACAADVSDTSLLLGQRGVLRRLCKAYLEHDRVLWAEERGYAARVTRMHRLEASPKNEILYGWTRDRPPPAEAVEGLSRLADDATLAESARLGLDMGCGVCVDEDARADETTAARLGAALAASEWDEAELAEVQATLQALAVGESVVLSASSARRRRLVHFAADALGLRHTTIAAVPGGERAKVSVARPDPVPVQVNHVA
jgi:hypothetical protein